MRSSLSSLALPTEYPKPVVKWLGGKSDLADQIIPLLPADVRARKWFEPFVGGGAMFFRLMPRCAVLSDTCADLIGLYDVLQIGDLNALTNELTLLADAHRRAPRANYEAIRKAFNQSRNVWPQDKVRRAAWFLYLNRTGFNGLHRVNSKDEFNVPFGDVDEFSFDVFNHIRCGAGLLSAELHHESFEHVLDRAQAGDVVYFDPPYLGTFTRYSGEFGIKQHTLLRDVFRALDNRGCIVVLSTSDHPTIHELYAGYEVTTVRAGRAVGARASSRGKVDELVIRGHAQ